MLDRAGYQMTGPARGGLPGLDRAEHCQVHGLRAGSSERQLVRPAAEIAGYRLAGLLEQQLGAAALAVQPGRIGPAILERCQQGLAGGRMQRLGGCCVEVGHVLTLGGGGLAYRRTGQ